MGGGREHRDGHGQPVRNGVITFRKDFAEPVALDDDTKIQVAIDTDQDMGTGIGGLDYSLDWSGSPALLTAVDGDPEASQPDSLRFRHSGSTVTFSIAARDIGSPERFDFYTFIEQPGHTDIAPVHVLFSSAWTYPEDDVPDESPYPTETYERISRTSRSRRPGGVESSSSPSSLAAFWRSARSSPSSAGAWSELESDEPVATRRKSPAPNEVRPCKGHGVRPC